MIWFEYNFLYVLCANGAPDAESMGSHSILGYNQRARFYAISDEGKLLYSQRVAECVTYRVVSLCHTTLNLLIVDTYVSWPVQPVFVRNREFERQKNAWQHIQHMHSS